MGAESGAGFVMLGCLVWLRVCSSRSVEPEAIQTGPKSLLSLWKLSSCCFDVFLVTPLNTIKLKYLTILTCEA